MPYQLSIGSGRRLTQRLRTACHAVLEQAAGLCGSLPAGESGSDGVRHAADNVVEQLESRTLLSTSWFVAPYGSDNNPGTINAPFRTLQRAANIANAGDHVEIRAGVYHETVKPAHSGTASAPIVFEAYHGEGVTVSGADPVTGWGGYSGAIYHASMPWTLGEGNDQVFVDGRMINEARWPNSSLDVSHPTFAHAQRVSLSGSTAVLYDSALNQPSGSWNGATIHIAPGQAWIAETGIVTASGPGWIRFSYQPIDRYELPKAGNAYYLTGTFRALDSAAEWYRANNGQLYLTTPALDNPARHDVEAKHRLYAFDVAGRSNITIQNLNLFAATINTDGGSSHLIVNHINAQYTGQFTKLRWGWDVPTNMGITLNGAYSILENSQVVGSAGDGVLVRGYGSRVTNNSIHDVDYSGGDAAAIRVLASGVTVDHNSIYNAGRDGIQMEGTGLKILYNTVTAVGQQTTEAGGIYTVHQYGGGTEVAYNKVSGFHSGGFGETGLFFDNSSGGYYIHNNIVTNVDNALKMNGVCRNTTVTKNNFSGSWYAVMSDQKGDWGGTKLLYNAFQRGVVVGPGAAVYANSSSAWGGYGTGDFASGATGGAFTPAPTPAPSPTPTPSPAPTPAPTPSPSSTSRKATGTFSALKYDAVYGLKWDNFQGLGYAQNGDWAEFKNLDFGRGINWFQAGVSGLSGLTGNIEVHVDSPTGTLAGTMKVSPTGAWNRYSQQYTRLARTITGVHNLFLVFRGGGTGIANLENFRFA